MASLAESMYAETLDTMRTPVDNKGLNNGLNRGADLAKAEMQNKVDMQRLDQAKADTELKKYTIFGAEMEKTIKLPPSMQSNRIDTIGTPMAAKMGFAFDGAQFKSLLKTKELDEAKIGRLFTDLREADMGGDKERTKGLVDEMMRLTHGDPDTVTKYILPVFKANDSNKNAQASRAQSDQHFAESRIEAFNSKKLPLAKEYRKEYTEINESTQRLQSLVKNLQEAKDTGNFPLFNQSIKEIVRQTDQRITDKDFALIAQRPGAKGMIDAALKFKGKVPPALANDIMRLLDLGAKSGDERRSRLNKNYEGSAKIIANMPGNVQRQTPIQIMSEFQMEQEDAKAPPPRDPKGQNLKGKAPTTPGQAPREKTLNDFMSDDQIQYSVSSILKHPELGKLGGSELRSKLSKLLTPQGYTETMLDQIMQKIATARAKQTKSGGQ